MAIHTVYDSEAANVYTHYLFLHGELVHVLFYHYESISQISIQLFICESYSKVIPKSRIIYYLKNEDSFLTVSLYIFHKCT